MTRATILAALFAMMLPLRAGAQDACHVALGELTVNDEPPPEQYRGMLADAIRPTIDPILQCYRDRVAQRPGLQGNLQLRLWVSARQVIRVTPETNTLQDPPLEQCAIAQIRRFTLPPEAPEGGARVRFVLRFTLSGAAATTTTPGTTTTTPGTTTTPPGATTTTPGATTTTPGSTTSTPGATTSTPGATTPGTTAPATGGRAPIVLSLPQAAEAARGLLGQYVPGLGAIAAPPRATITVGTIRGAMSAEVLASSIPGDRFDACPAGAGTIEARLTIAADGAIRARAAGGTIRDRATRRCAQEALQAVRAPAAAGTTRATITITLAR